MATLEPPITKPKRYSPISFWLHSHMRAILSSFGDLMRAPLATGMTILVFAIAMALPLSFITILHGVSPIKKQWQQQPTLTLYLNQNITPDTKTALLSQLKQLNFFEKMEYISPEKGLKELATQANLSDSITQAIDNPLPGVIVLTVSQKKALPSQLKKWQTALSHLTGVQSVQVNLQWLERLYYLINLLHRFAYGLAALFALGLFFLIANTIRLVLQNSRTEVQVLKLVGASAAFIRRPLLYRGFWLGILGAIVAWLIVMGLMIGIMPPLSELANSYGLPAYYQPYDYQLILASSTLAALLGVLAARLVCSRFLSLSA